MERLSLTVARDRRKFVDNLGLNAPDEIANGSGIAELRKARRLGSATLQKSLIRAGGRGPSTWIR
jgi:hypothetical protein